MHNMIFGSENCKLLVQMLLIILLRELMFLNSLLHITLTNLSDSNFGWATNLITLIRRFLLLYTVFAQLRVSIANHARLEAGAVGGGCHC